jgi:hypothetical protein
MADVLGVAALKIGDPVVLFILMKPNYTTLNHC